MLVRPSASRAARHGLSDACGALLPSVARVSSSSGLLATIMSTLNTLAFVSATTLGRDMVLRLSGKEGVRTGAGRYGGEEVGAGGTGGECAACGRACAVDSLRHQTLVHHRNSDRPRTAGSAGEHILLISPGRCTWAACVDAFRMADVDGLACWRAGRSNLGCRSTIRSVSNRCIRGLR